MSTFKTVITREIEVEVEYEYSKACKGGRDAYGQQEEPDEPESVEIVSVRELTVGVGDGGKPIKTYVNGLPVTQEEIDQLEQEALEDVKDRYEAAAEAKDDAHQAALRDGLKSWDLLPWVWRYEFARVK